MAKKFQRKIENFTCKKCGFKVTGTGYTNHCPKCLYSLHVDINPGDRAETCGGMMGPVEMEIKNGQYIIFNKCEKCGHINRCKSSPGDDLDALLTLSQNLVKKRLF